MKNTQFPTKDTLIRTLPVVSPVNFPKILEENVGNFCPVCGKTIFSNLLKINGKVYLEKNCCTKELVFIENDSDFFMKHKSCNEVGPLVSEAKNYLEWISANPNYGTPTVDLFVSFKCNTNCPICYCRNDHFVQKAKSWLEPSIKEIKKELKKYHSREILLIGGEPTTREDLFEIIRAIKKSGNRPGIITNGLKLEDKNYVKKLKKNGLDSIGLSFDGFNNSANIKLRGQDLLDKKLKVLKNIKEVGGLRRVVLMPVIGKGVNETEISKIIQFGMESEFINKICFLGLVTPQNWNEESTTRSDLIKIMEKEDYFDKTYFLGLVKMYRNIYEVIRKIFRGTVLEDWFFKRLSGSFSVVHFVKGTNPPQLLFRKKEVEKINEILTKILCEENRTVSFGVLLKNLKELIKSPLSTLLREKFFILKKKNSSSNKLLEVSFHGLGSPSGINNAFLKIPRSIILETFRFLPAFSTFAIANPD